VSYRNSITLDWALQFGPCTGGPEWFQRRGFVELSIFDLYEHFKEDGLLKYMNWTLCRFLTPRDRQLYTINAALSVLHLYEERFPDDPLPRELLILAGDGAKRDNVKVNVFSEKHFSIPAYYAAYAAYRADLAPEYAEEGVMDAAKACGSDVIDEVLESFCDYGMGLISERIESNEDMSEVIPMPPLREQFFNLATAVMKTAKNLVGGDTVIASQEKREERMSICQECPFLRNGRCLKCGCVTSIKIASETERCPVGKW